MSPLNGVSRIKSHLKGSVSDRVQTLHKPLLSCSVFPISRMEFFKIYCSRRGTTYTKAPPVLQRVPDIMHSIVKLSKTYCSRRVVSYTKAPPVLQRVSQVKPCVAALSLIMASHVIGQFGGDLRNCRKIIHFEYEVDK